jgi:hypothetical protein
MAFKKGQSGNPSGRPKGISTAAKLRKAIEDKADAILDVVNNAALSGDLQACQFLLGRVIPPLKGVQPAAALSVAKNANMATQASVVVQGALSGEVSADVASQLVGSMASLAKIIETSELIRRIEALEEKRNGQS